MSVAALDRQRRHAPILERRIFVVADPAVAAHKLVDQLGSRRVALAWLRSAAAELEHERGDR